MASEQTASAAQPVRRESIPPALWVIAIVALTPFPLSAWVYAYGPAGLVRSALGVILIWSAVVLAFLGGVRWGMETGRTRPRWPRLMISVGSAVAAWALLLARNNIPDAWVLGGCIAAFLVQWLFDHQAPDVPARYPRLSTALTAAACLSLAVCLDQALKL